MCQTPSYKNQTAYDFNHTDGGTGLTFPLFHLGGVSSCADSAAEYGGVCAIAHEQPANADAAARHPRIECENDGRTGEGDEQGNRPSHSC